MDASGAAVSHARFEFTGRAGEYFRIWIANVFLTIITLGIYSAWAKVRRNRYLYGSTRLEGAAFDYLADPVAILKGRLLAVGFFVLYGVSGHVSPFLQLFFALLVLPFVPWVVIRSRRFALRNTAYRNIRFDFAAGYGEAIAVYLLWPMIVAFSLMLLHPLYVWQRAKFLVENAAFGMQAVGFVAQKGAYFLAYLKFFFVFMAVFVAGGVGVGAAMAGADPGRVPVAVPVVLVATLLALLASLSYKHVLVTNITWSGIEIGGMRSHCALRTPRIYWIALSNLVAIVASFGLLIPWATIRMTRYRVESMRLTQAENLESLVAAQTETVGAAGEEIGELLGIDVGL